MTYGREGVYLDHAATTPTDPAVVESMLPWFTERFGNPSSIYQIGQEARAAIDNARRQIAGVLRCVPSEVLFTSGATESNNLAIRASIGAWRQKHGWDRKPHVVISAIEHHAVLDVVLQLRDEGLAVDIVPCDSIGRVDPAAVEAAVKPETCLISVMLVNNEIGTVQPVPEIAAVARERGIVVHTDAVQAAGLRPIAAQHIGVDMLSLSAHKFYGPKGVGVLFVRKGTPMRFQQRGGSQEAGRRGGTENVPLIVGMGEALQRADAISDQYATHCRVLRDRLWKQLQERVPGILRNGTDDPESAQPNILNVVLPGVQGETMLLNLDLLGVSASAGSACTTGNPEPSHVVRAIGRNDEECRASLRFSVGRGNSLSEMDEAARVVAESVERVRALSGTVSSAG
ncbi:MAG TPA: cysteine desulfurase family protein [Thermomicrobiales bacterium]|nr:cysteine desulfurase family protein [Thermomicrobiales bacterium]